jgi:hypothetical protein
MSITSTALRSAAHSVPKSSPALLGVAIAAGLFGALTLERTTATAAARNNLMGGGGTNRLEQDFGTADGYFPSATPGASLSKPPGNRVAIAGEHYVAVSERGRYATKRKKTLRSLKTMNDMNSSN